MNTKDFLNIRILELQAEVDGINEFLKKENIRDWMPECVPYLPQLLVLNKKIEALQKLYNVTPSKTDTFYENNV